MNIRLVLRLHGLKFQRLVSVSQSERGKSPPPTQFASNMSSQHGLMTGSLALLDSKTFQAQLISAAFAKQFFSPLVESLHFPENYSFLACQSNLVSAGCIHTFLWLSVFSFQTDWMQHRTVCNELFQKHFHRNVLENTKKLYFQDHVYTDVFCHLFGWMVPQEYYFTRSLCSKTKPTHSYIMAL